MSKKTLIVRPVRPTVLVVGESYAEYELLRHIRALYVPEKNSLHLTVGNARALNSAKVIGHALTMSKQAKFDRIGVFLSTSMNWPAAIERRAKAARIRVLPATPCLEAWLLDVIGQQGVCAVDEHKVKFQKLFEGHPSDPGLLTTYFGRNAFDNARDRMPTLDELLTLVSR